jgi:hypothetical protein
MEGFEAGYNGSATTCNLTTRGVVMQVHDNR